MYSLVVVIVSRYCHDCAESDENNVTHSLLICCCFGDASDKSGSQAAKAFLFFIFYLSRENP